MLRWLLSNLDFQRVHTLGLIYQYNQNRLRDSGSSYNDAHVNDKLQFIYTVEMQPHKANDVSHCFYLSFEVLIIYGQRNLSIRHLCYWGLTELYRFWSICTSFQSVFSSHIIRKFNDGRIFIEDRFQFSLVSAYKQCGDRLDSMYQLLLCYMNISKVIPEGREGKDTTYRYVNCKCIKVQFSPTYDTQYIFIPCTILWLLWTSLRSWS